VAFLIHIDPDHGILHSGLDHPLLHQHGAFQQNDALAAFDPAGNLIGVQDNRLGISGSILRQAQNLIAWSRQRRPIRQSSQQTEDRQAFSKNGELGHGTSFLMLQRAWFSFPLL
jgi:hypothetical protein